MPKPNPDTLDRLIHRDDVRALAVNGLGATTILSFDDHPDAVGLSDEDLVRYLQDAVHPDGVWHPRAEELMRDAAI